MKLSDEIVLRIKRKDGLAAAAVHDAYRWLLRWNMPDTPLVNRVARLAFQAHDAMGHGARLVAAKLLYEPMTRARFASVGKHFHVTELPYILATATSTSATTARCRRSSSSRGGSATSPSFASATARPSAS